MLTPLENRVVIAVSEAERQTPGGILLPDTAKNVPQRGTVVAVGPGRMADSGQRVPMFLTVGDEVVYPRYAGNDVEVNEQKFKVLTETEILARVNE